jgi:multiple sugar transport system ATP-binding protein
VSADGALDLRGATKRFGETTVFSDLDLAVPAASFTVLVGPSGCGKSTCLRALAGLERLDAGKVLVGGVDVTDVPARDRGLTMVFQDFALYPHMTVAQNITFGLRLAARRGRGAGPSKTEIATRLADVVALLRLDGLEGRRPAELSGGQRQRVALARSIVRRPRAFLMDEPLSNLDAQLREQTRAELVRLHGQLSTTFVYVTHDQVEALSMATRLVVLDAGTIAQAGPPEEVYARPRTTFVARFIGSPPMNLLPMAADRHGQGAVFTAAGASGGVDAVTLPGQVIVGWRPARGRLVEPGSVSPGLASPGLLSPGLASTGLASTGLASTGLLSPGRIEPTGLTVTGRIEVVEHLGETRLLVAGSPTGRWTILIPAAAPSPPPGSEITAHVPAADLHFFDEAGNRVPTADPPG